MEQKKEYFELSNTYPFAGQRGHRPLRGWDESVLSTKTAIVGDDALIVPHRKRIVCFGGSLGKLATPTGNPYPLVTALPGDGYGDTSA
ncbi:MAG: hypothetical protein FWD58_05630 [Firmicutes bacterium]|nr:hypothetical protein [Bacillota bacterium]